MFLHKITLCNLFAYYGRVEVAFEYDNYKNLYCIYGNNGYGKTSFMRSAKLLFLGAGLIDDEISPVIARFAQKDSRHISPLQLIKGIGEQWLGILNKAALREGQKEFYVRFEGSFDDKSFSIKRSFINVYDELEEHLEFVLENESFRDKEAQERLNKIMPPNLIEFFFFDGEELEKISENLRKEFKDKIEDILHIKPLDIAIREIEKYKQELRDNENKNKDNAALLTQKRKEKELKEIELSHLREKIKNYEQELEENEQALREKIRQLDRLGSDYSEEKAGLVSEKDRLDKEFMEAKESFKESIKSVVFVANGGLVEALHNELTKLEENKSKQDIQSYKKLLPDLKELVSKELEQLDMPQYCITMETILENAAKKLEQKSFAHSFLASAMFTPLKESLVRVEQNSLSKDLAELKSLKNKLEKNKALQNELISDEYTRQRQEQLDQERKALQEKKQQKEKDKESIKDALKVLESHKEQIEKDIYNLEQNINTERIDKKLKILESLQKSIEQYKQKLTAKLREELHWLILQNYQTLLPSDNVREIVIDEDFNMRLQDENNELIVIENQSSGQKQILAIAIFWALSKLAQTNLPLIIDTPLGRIDNENRARIIQNYYANGTQAILLPLDSEIGKREYEYAKPHLAGLYKIENQKDRRHGSIKKAEIDEIL